MRQHFIVQDRCILAHKDILNGKCGYLGEEDAPERICKRGIDACEREDGMKWIVTMEGDVCLLAKEIKRPAVILAGVVQWVFFACSIFNSLSIYLNSL